MVQRQARCRAVPAEMATVANSGLQGVLFGLGLASAVAGVQELSRRATRAAIKRVLAELTSDLKSDLKSDLAELKSVVVGLCIGVVLLAAFVAYYK